MGLQGELSVPLNVASNGHGEAAGGSVGSVGHVHVRRWVMHGAVMFGREFCYAMETALVTPLLLQIGLPEEYYSLTWFLSPVLGLIFTPLMGSASDGCTLRWGRRRPFILALCLGMLLGLALFLNGARIGLSVGDTPGNQLTGVILTVAGVVVLDFCADGSDGPIRAYLLDVAEPEEQDLALNVHAVCSGLGGAVGYIMGGLDWTPTFLGKAFKTQEQVLFFFSAVFLTASLALHLCSVNEQPWSAQPSDESHRASSVILNVDMAPPAVPKLPAVIEDTPFHFSRDDCYGPELERFLDVEIMRSKSDSVLTTADPTLGLQLEDLFLHERAQRILQECQSCLQTAPFLHSSVDSQENLSHRCPILQAEEPAFASKATEPLAENLAARSTASLHPLCNRTGIKPSTVGVRPRCSTYYRQASFTFSYYGRVGGGVRRGQRVRGGRLSLSMNDLDELRSRPRHRRRCSSSQDDDDDDEGAESESEDVEASVRLLWLSMLKMPPELRRLCLCHLLTWFSFTSEAVFYTDFIGQAVYGGSPSAAANSTDLQSYHRGVQMGCWGLAVYAAVAAICSALLQKILDSYDLSIKLIYILGTLSFSVGTAMMAAFPNLFVCMAMISAMGIISMSMSYCPYALLGQYHELKEYIQHSPGPSKRGFGVDCAILTCQVYVAQILVASALGAVVDGVGSVRVVPMVSSGVSFLGFAVSAFLVIYPESDEDAVKARDEKAEEGGSQVRQLG